jgi:carbonic anhydrase/acetyltransferase-like protein (isoleucine patch superfamily)
MLIRGYKGKTPVIGEGVFIAENATIIGDVEIGDHSSIWYGTVVRGDVFHIRIGSRTNIQDNCTLHVTNGTWPVVLEDEVTVGHGVILHGCTVGRGSLIGMGSRLLDGVVIGEHSLVGAGSLVTQNTHIPARSLVLGSPARVVRSLTADEVAGLAAYYQNYLEYKEIYLAESTS